MKSRLHIIAASKANCTYLKDSFCTQPFKIGNVTERDNRQSLKLMIMSSSPGILDNDEYEIDIDVQKGARLHISTQAYQRLFTMKNSAQQITNVHLADNTSFIYLPHPNVPHKSSAFKNINNIYISAEHNLLWSEIITCGRKSCNEEFTFTSFQSITNVYLENKLVVKENIFLKPSAGNISVMGQLEGYTHQSSLLFINNNADCNDLMEQCKDFLEFVDEIEYGMSELPVNGFIIRMLGHKGERLFQIQKQLVALIDNPVSVIANY